MPFHSMLEWRAQHSPAQLIPSAICSSNSRAAETQLPAVPKSDEYVIDGTEMVSSCVPYFQLHSVLYMGMHVYIHFC